MDDFKPIIQLLNKCQNLNKYLGTFIKPDVINSVKMKVENVKKDMTTTIINYLRSIENSIHSHNFHIAESKLRILETVKRHLGTY